MASTLKPSRFRTAPAVAFALALSPIIVALAADGEETGSLRTGSEIYLAACSSCHGADGRGASRDRVGFDLPLPDFSDCDFATREPDGDWAAVAREGGPARAFSERMPAFGSALSVDQIELAVAYLRSFCSDGRWPRGELNLPRPLVTEKAYPEDEAVLTVTGSTAGPDTVVGKIVYEQRFGPRSQVEIVLPLGWRERVVDDGVSMTTDWTSGVGDLAVAVKHAFHHDVGRGSIASVTGEMILPTGDEDADGFGKGTTIFEPFLTYGQLLPAEFFLHTQAGFEIPLDHDKADDEAFLRAALGRVFVSGRWGRSWSPMVELLGARELVSGAGTEWDVVPQMQVTLSRRQHVMLNVGVRTPLNRTAGRDTQVLAYVLWDWFDGGLFDGW